MIRIFSNLKSALLCIALIGGVAGVSPAEGEVENAGGIEDGGDTSPAEEADINLPHIYTYIDAPVVEQRQVFTQDDIKKAHLKDLPSVIESAGVQLLSYGTYGLEQKPSIRGFTDETVRVVIDGICMNNAQTGTFDFSTIDINSIEKIEIIRGGFTEGVEDEGAVGGVIYITTKKQSLSRHLTSDTSIKSFANLKTSPLTLDTFSERLSFDSPLGESTFFKLSGAYTNAQNSFLYKDFFGSIVTQKHAAVWDTNLSAQLSHFYGNGSSFTVTDAAYYGNKHTPNTITSRDWGLQKDLTNNLTLSFFNPSVFDLFNLTNTVAYLKTDRKYKSSTEDSHHKIDDFKYFGQMAFFDYGILRTTAGLSFDATFLDSTNSGNHTQLSGVFKQTSKLFFNEWLSMTVPLAVKFCGNNWAFVPKIGLAAKFNALEILADTYRMVQFPNMDDLYWEGGGYHGNPDLVPEEGWGAELTFNVKAGPVPSSVQFFTNYYEKKIAWSGGTTQNYKSAFYFGIDFNAQTGFFDDVLLFRLNGEYLYNKLLDKNDDMTYGKKIMWTPDFVAGAGMTLNFAKWDATLNANYMGKRYLTNLNISYLEPYTLFNLSANLKTFDHAEPYLKIENLLNTSYTSVDGYAMPGRSITIGARLNF
ncbi:MAG: TonB-dependent receptor [Treponema sp.]|nr:TonB-dependent receptor [Treponema sp.]